MSLQFHIVVSLGPRRLVHIDHLVLGVHEVPGKTIAEITVGGTSLMGQLEFETAVLHDADVLIGQVGQSRVIRNRGIARAEDVLAARVKILQFPRQQPAPDLTVQTDIPGLGDLPRHEGIGSRARNDEVYVLVIVLGLVNRRI